MKNIIFGLLMIISFAAIAQGPPAGTYTPVSGGFNWGRGFARSWNLPVLTEPAFAPNQWQMQGAIIYDSLGGNKGIHVWNGTTWVRIVDTTWISLVTTKDRFGFLTEDTRATAARTFQAANQVFTIDSMGHGSLFRQRSRAIVANTLAFSNKDANDSAYVRLQGVNAATHEAQIGVSNVAVATSTNLGSYLRFTSGGAASSLLKAQMYTANDAGHIGEFTQEPTYTLMRSYNIATDAWSNISLYHDSSTWWQGLHRTAVLNFKDGAQDQFARDSVTWRLTNRDASLTFNSTGWHAWQKDGEYYFYNIERETDTTGLDLLAWDRAASELKRVPSNLVGGGGGGSTPTLQQVLTAGSTLAGPNNIDGSADDLIFDNFLNMQFGSSSILFPLIGGAHAANDSMLVINASSKTIGYRPIPSGGGLTVGTTTIASGTNTRILYDNSGVLGEYTLTGTGTVVAMQTSPTLITSAKVQYDGSNHLVITPASTGDIGFVATGSAPSFTFNKGLSITGTYGALNDGGQLFWDAGGNTFYIDSRSGGSARAIILQGAAMDFKSSGSTTMTLSGANVTIPGLAGTGSRTVLADASGVLSAPVSDRSVKQFIRPINYGLNTIMNLKPVSFEYREGWKNYGEGTQIGFIAQDIEKVLPNSVFTTQVTGKMGYNETDLIPVLVKAVQELTARVEALENENKKLKRK